MGPAEERFEAGCRAMARHAYRKAERCFADAIAAAPGWHNAWQRRAWCRGYLGRPKEAISDYRRALKLQPSCAWCWEALSDLYVDARRYADACACIQKAMRFRPRYPSFRYDLGVVLLKLGHYRKASRVFETLRGRMIFGMLWRQGRGRARALLGDSDRAIKDLSACVTSFPDDYESWMFRSLAKLKAGDRDGASKDWTKARALSGRLPSFKKISSTASNRLLIGIASAPDRLGPG